MYIPARGSGAPTHTAPRGAMYYRTSNDTVYIQTAGATGSTWVVLGPGGSGDLVSTQNLNDLASIPTSFSNLINGLSSSSFSLTDLIGVKSGAGGLKQTVQQFYNIINSLTAETAPVYNDKLPLYDTSASQTDAVTIANLMQHGKAVVVEYTGSGSSGKTVTLTGINRAHHIFIGNHSNSGYSPFVGWPKGGTGTQTCMATQNGNHSSELSFGTQAAGSSQVLTVNSTTGFFNASGHTYRVLVVGTPA